MADAPRRIAVLALSGALACCRPGAADAPAASRADEELALLRLERAMFDALRDRRQGAIAALLTDDFVARDATGAELDKAAFLASVAATPGRIVSVEGEHVKARVYGDVGVLTGVQRATVRLPDGREVRDAGAFTDVCLKRGGRWQIALAHSVPLGDGGAKPSE
ncbi:MAG TPA: nuclear transport factor 2 family protein [Polyangiaceae bacterium]|nr:nuclear transport factor 2 family protein [Polyangiaceae bacterium]